MSQFTVHFELINSLSRFSGKT